MRKSENTRSLLLGRSWYRRFAAVLIAALLVETFASGNVYASQLGELSAVNGIQADKLANDAAATEVLSETEAPIEELAEADAFTEVLTAEETMTEELTVDEVLPGGLAVQEPEREIISLEEPERDESGNKAFTVMLYDVSSDLERNHGCSTKDLVEIMNGIKTGAGDEEPAVNFVVETGGMKLEDAAAETAYDEMIDDIIEEAQDKDKPLLKNVRDNVDFTENHRWVLSANGLEIAANDDEAIRDQPMSASVNGINTELLNFIKSSVEDYPADQYILLFWNHGGGSLVGFGADERAPGEYFNSYNVAMTMAETGLFGPAASEKKLAWVGYDACLMADTEVALTWEPYARYFGGSEELEGGDGWSWTGWVSTLYKDTLGHGPYGQAEADRLIEKIGSKYVEDFAESYEDNATAVLLDLSKIRPVATGLKNYSTVYLDKMKQHPVPIYKSMLRIHDDVKGYGSLHASMIDLKNFVEVTNSNLQAYLSDFGLTLDEAEEISKALKAEGSKLTAAVDAAVVKEAHTKDMEGSSGMTVFFPYRMKDCQSDWMRYRKLYEEDVFKEAPYLAIVDLDTYRDLISLYMSIFSTGKWLENGEITLPGLTERWTEALAKFEIGEHNDTEEMNKLPTTLYDNRVQNEALKIAELNGEYKFLRRSHLLFESFEEKLLSENETGTDNLYYGSMPNGEYAYNEAENIWEQPLYNYNKKEWFAFRQGGEDIMVPILYAQSETHNVRKDETEVVFPLLDDEQTLYFVTACFNKNSNEGKIVGAKPFLLSEGQFERFYPVDEFLDKEYAFDLVGNIAEFIDGFVDEFDVNNWDYYCVGSVTLNKGSKLYRNVGLPENEDLTTRMYARDIFDNYYEFGSFKERLSVRPALGDNVDAIRRGAVIKESDIKARLFDAFGNELGYEADGFDYYAIINEKPYPLYVDDKGAFCYDRTDTGTERLTAGAGLKIGLSVNACYVDSYTSIDNANVMLNDSFEIGFDKTEGIFTVPIHDTNVSFISLADGYALAASETVPGDKMGEGGRISVGDKAVIVKEDPIKWYYTAGDSDPVLVYENGKAIPYNGLVLVEAVNSGGFNFYLPESNGETEVIFYAGFASTEPRNEGSVEAYVEPVYPVDYTGRTLVTTMSRKTGSKVIGLVIRTTDGKILTEDTDYTVSYKNNKNVAGVDDKKPPTLTVKGKSSYKGLKYEVKYAIVPADFSKVIIEVDRFYAPLNSNTKKGITLRTTLKLPEGTKVPTKNYEIHYYTKDAEGNKQEITKEQLSAQYKGKKCYELYVSAKAVCPDNKATNYVTGSVTDPDNDIIVYAYPSSSKVSLTLKKSSYDYSGGTVRVSEIMGSENIKTLKAGKTVIDVSCLKAPVAYYDSKLTQPVGSDELTDAGIYYITAELKDEFKQQYKVYNAKAVKVTVKGTSLPGKAFKLKDTSLSIKDINERYPEKLPVTILIDKSIFKTGKCKVLEVEGTIRDGGKVTGEINLENMPVEGDNIIATLDFIDNGSPGSYKITIYGKEGYTNKKVLNYKVTK